MRYNMIIEDIAKISLEMRKNAIKSTDHRDKIKASVVNTLKSDIAMIGKNAGRDTTEEEAINYIMKFRKNIIESLTHATNKNDEQNITKFSTELEVVNMFTPKQLSDDRIVDIINTLLANSTNVTIKDVTAFFKANYHNQYDGRRLVEIFKSL